MGVEKGVREGEREFYRQSMGKKRKLMVSCPTQRKSVYFLLD